jgi:hypothetical protein
MQNQVVFQSFRAFKTGAAVLTFVLFLIAVNNLFGMRSENEKLSENKQESGHGVDTLTMCIFNVLLVLSEIPQMLQMYWVLVWMSS